MRFPKPLSIDRTALQARSGVRRARCVALAAAFTAPVHAAADLTSHSLAQLPEVTVVGASKHEQRQGEGAVVDTPTELPGIVADHAAPAAPVAAGLEDQS